MDRAVLVSVAIAVGVAVLVVGLGLAVGWSAVRSDPSATCVPALTWSVTNATSDLGDNYAPGSLQAFGDNGSGIVTGGIGSFNDTKPSDFSSPVLTALGGVRGSAPTNLTGLVEPYFHGGGVFVPVWNGTSWLIVGSAGWGARSSEGAAVAIDPDGVHNLSGEIQPYFAGGGIWIGAWNGSAYLLGGQGPHGAALVSLQGNSVRDYSPLVPSTGDNSWIQMLGWNGTAWTVGGFGVLALFEEGRLTDLRVKMPFPGGGVYGIGWNGTTWMFAGSPTQPVAWDGSHVIPGPTLPKGFDAWTNMVLPFAGGWLFAGGGVSPTGRDTAQVAYASSCPGAPVVDLAGQLPGAFDGGYVQFGAPAPAIASNEVLLVGNGGIEVPAFSSHGAAAYVMAR